MDKLKNVNKVQTTEYSGYHVEIKLETGNKRGVHSVASVVPKVEIPKSNGGTRLLGIPTVVDRMIQQAIAQVLTVVYEPTFSNSSYGFRPGRSQHQAIKQSLEYINQGYKWVVDIDLEKFFDKVNHDILIDRLSRRIEDKRVLDLIRKYLKSGLLLKGRRPNKNT